MDLIAGSLILIGFSAWVLRKPTKPFDPSRRFRTLRKLGLIGRGREKEDS